MYVLIIIDRVGDVNIKNKTAAFRTDRIETIHVIQNTAVPFLRIAVLNLIEEETRC